ncbi:MAG: hypothetical protein FJ399_01845 [Verrucomicrobia bacterium]|nr:hypothetical protein [Verrucomicrobiota bacterium]
MICALLMGREGSSGFPGKNLYPVLGRPMVVYPMAVANACPSVDRLFVSTDSPAIKELARQAGAEIIDRPAYLASKEALGEDVYVHGYRTIKERLATEGQSVELVVLLMANGVTVTPQSIEEGIAALRANPEADSAVTVSCYNMWSPLRARKINARGYLDPFVPFETFGDPKKLNCDRDSQGDVWFADMGTSIVRPHCLDHIETGLLPQKWMGRKILPLLQWGGLDVDEPWQIPGIEAWLQAHEVDKLFRVQRFRWNHFYDSERAVLSVLRMDRHSRVLDLGSDPGGLGLALRERFGVVRYAAVVGDQGQASEVKELYPEAEVMIGDAGTETVAMEGGFDLIAGLGLDDDQEFFPAGLRSAFERLAPGGTLVFTVRLTTAVTICDVTRSYQSVRAGKSAMVRNPYVVRNIGEAMSVLRGLEPARIFAFGYIGIPSSAAQTPLKTVCFCVIAVTRRRADEQPAEPKVQLELPAPFDALT